MRRLLLNVSALLAVMLLVSSCIWWGREPIRRPLVFDVRDVAVIADGRVPLALATGVDRRVAAAINSTIRTVPTERVVLTVRFEEFRTAQPFGDRRARASFRVTATDIDRGSPIAAGTFIVYSTTDNPMMAIDSLAEEAAARIRFAFSLEAPRIARPRPPARTVSTRLATERPVRRPSAGDAAPAISAPPKPAPAKPKAAVPAVGTNVEEGASGTIRLPAAKPACDTASDPSCKP